MIVQHMGGVPELAMVLGPVLLIGVYVWIAWRGRKSDDEDPPR